MISTSGFYFSLDLYISFIKYRYVMNSWEFFEMRIFYEKIS